MQGGAETVIWSAGAVRGQGSGVRSKGSAGLGFRRFRVQSNEGSVDGQKP